MAFRMPSNPFFPGGYRRADRPTWDPPLRPAVRCLRQAGVDRLLRQRGSVLVDGNAANVHALIGKVVPVGLGHCFQNFQRLIDDFRPMPSPFKTVMRLRITNLLWGDYFSEFKSPPLLTMF